MRRVASLKRKRPSRAPSKKIFVFGEGKLTEADYFRAMQRKIDIREFQLIYEGGKGDPSKVVQAAQEFARRSRTSSGRRPVDSLEVGDEIWVMFDRDDHDLFEQTKRSCESQKLFYIYCNPCFELWLVLHFQDCEGPTNSFQAQEMTKNLVKGYDPKTRKTGDFDAMMPRLPAAENRAKRQRLNRQQEDRKDGNPSTNFYEFTSKFEKFFRS
ncbi:MAG: RloB domain-containing protein [Roseomonas sp.]|nr:RloB domain-containing protein [Roseomonas sp.]